MTRTLTSRQNPPASGWNSQIVSSRSPRASLISLFEASLPLFRPFFLAFVSIRVRYSSRLSRRQCQLAGRDARAVEVGLRNDRHEDPVVLLVHGDRPILGDPRRQAVLGGVERLGRREAHSPAEIATEHTSSKKAEGIGPPGITDSRMKSAAYDRTCLPFNT